MATISRETTKTLLDTVKMVKDIEALDAKIQPPYKKMSDGLQAGIDDASEEEIELYRPQLEKVGKMIDTALNSITGAIGLITQLRKDEALMAAKFNEIEKLVKTVAAKRKKLSEQSAAARKLIQAAEKGLVAAQKGAQSAEADLSALQDSVATIMKTMERVDVEAPKLEAQAKKAIEKKDQKNLTDARVKLIDMHKDNNLATRVMRPKITKYRAQYPDITKDQKNELQYMLDDLDRADSIMETVQKMINELMKVGQLQAQAPAKKAPMAPGDLAKCVKAVGMKAGDSAKLGKILNDMARDKWADALGKLATTLKLEETDGKKMVLALNKVDAIKKAQLIDI